jgi:hypothetical protein
MAWIPVTNHNGLLVRRVPGDVFTASARAIETLYKAAAAEPQFFADDPVAGDPSGAHVPRQPAAESKGGQRTARRITKEEANIRAREALKTPGLRSVRKLAKAIGCSTGMAAKLPAWLAHQAELEQQGKKKAPGPKAMGLTDRVLSAKGQDDSQLETLIAEQQADFEESPLVSRARKHRRRPKV